MRGTRAGARRRVLRLGCAALLALVVAGGTATVSSARPSRRDLADARARLASLNQRLSQLVERYDATRLSLQQAQARLARATAAAQRAEAQADRARQELDARAAQAYQGVGTEIDLLLGATSLSDFTDRFEFLGSVAQSDVDLATQAEVAGQAAQRASAALARVVAERRALLRSLAATRRDIEEGIAEQRALVRRLERQLSRAAVRRALEQPGPPPPSSPVPAAAPPVPAAAPAPPSPPGSAPSPQPAPPASQPGPPPPSSRADQAVAAAYSALGVPYRWGGDSPSTGFDCSGLTMWAWAHAGVSLPHSSAAQYAVLPHVSRSDLRPGDLLFFYQPISHVGIYVGGNKMIHASHPGTVVSLVAISSYYWAVYSGAGRPG